MRVYICYSCTCDCMSGRRPSVVTISIVLAPFLGWMLFDSGSYDHLSQRLRSVACLTGGLVSVLAFFFDWYFQSHPGIS